MVSLLTALIFVAVGLTANIVLAALGPSLPVEIRQKIGRHHYKNAMKSYGKAAIIWRTLGGPELKPVRVNDEAKNAEVVLSSGTVSDDERLPFRDPDDRIYRLHKKPLAVIAEPFPAATDAELSEIGHAFNRKASDEGIVTDGVVDLSISVPSELRAVNPLDTMYLLAKGVEPQYVQSTEEFTKSRFRYGGSIGAKETLTTIASFASGAGVVMGLFYVRDEVLGDGGNSAGGGSTVGIPGGIGQIQIHVQDYAIQTMEVLAL